MRFPSFKVVHIYQNEEIEAPKDSGLINKATAISSMSPTDVLYSNNSHCVLRTPTNEFYSLEDIAMTTKFLYNLQRLPSA